MTTSPWVWIDHQGVRYLAYSYVDPTAGPSAKGAAVSNPPARDELAAVIEKPDRTFREPAAFGARALEASEVSRLALPDKPPWLAVFEGGRAPAPRGAAVRSVRGRVTCAGAPAAGARVTLYTVFGLRRELLDVADADTAADGTFTAHDVPDGHDVVAQAHCTDGAVSAVVPVPRGDSAVELEAARPASVRGAVTRGGRPADARVALVPVGERGGGPGYASTDAAGRFRIDGLAPGTYRAVVERVLPDGMTGGLPAVRSVELAAGQAVAVDVELAVGCDLEVHVRVRSANEQCQVYLFTGEVPLARVTDVRAALAARDEATARSANSLSSLGLETVTTFHDVTPGVYTVCAGPWAPGRELDPATTPVSTQRVVVAEGAAAQRVELPLWAP